MILLLKEAECAIGGLHLCEHCRLGCQGASSEACCAFVFGSTTSGVWKRADKTQNWHFSKGLDVLLYIILTPTPLLRLFGLNLSQGPQCQTIWFRHLRTLLGVLCCLYRTCGTSRPSFRPQLLSLLPFSPK